MEQAKINRPKLPMARQSRERERINRWKAHFKTVLNRPIPLQTPYISESEEGIDISTDPITVEELKHAITKVEIWEGTMGRRDMCRNVEGW